VTLIRLVETGSRDWEARFHFSKWESEPLLTERDRGMSGTVGIYRKEYLVVFVCLFVCLHTCLENHSFSINTLLLYISVGLYGNSREAFEAQVS
jgi:hypothetical protein